MSYLLFIGFSHFFFGLFSMVSVQFEKRGFFILVVYEKHSIMDMWIGFLYILAYTIFSH